MLTNPRYEVRETNAGARFPWGVFDTFVQEWVEEHIAKDRAIRATAAHNRVYAQAMVDHD